MRSSAGPHVAPVDLKGKGMNSSSWVWRAALTAENGCGWGREEDALWEGTKDTLQSVCGSMDPSWSRHETWHYLPSTGADVGVIDVAPPPPRFYSQSGPRTQRGLICPQELLVALLPQAGPLLWPDAAPVTGAAWAQGCFPMSLSQGLVSPSQCLRSLSTDS